MARIRTFKPEFFTSETVGELSMPARLAFMGLWIHADRKGRLNDKPRTLKALIFPFDNVDFNELLNEIVGVNLIHRYEVEGKGYIQIKGFEEHQRPHPKEPESVIPDPSLIQPLNGQPENATESPEKTRLDNEETRQAVKKNGETLSSREKVLSSREGKEGKGMDKGKGKEGVAVTRDSRASTPHLCDSEYLTTLQVNPAYADLDVVKVYGKMTAWCQERKKLPTRRRLLDWLNREDRTMKAPSNGDGVTISEVGLGRGYV